MSFGTARAEVASDVTLRVTTPQQNSFVALVAIDKGSQLLGAPNDITESEVSPPPYLAPPPPPPPVERE